MVDNVLVNRGILRNKNDGGFPLFSSHPSRLLPEARYGTWVAREDAEVKITNINTKLQCICGDDRLDLSFEQVTLQLPSLVRQKTASIGLYYLFKLRPLIDDRPVETLYLLPGTAKADSANVSFSSLTKKWYGYRCGSLPIESIPVATYKGRIDEVEVPRRLWRSISLYDGEFAMKQCPGMFSRIPDSGRGADKYRFVSMNLTDPGKTPENIRNV